MLNLKRTRMFQTVVFLLCAIVWSVASSNLNGQTPQLEAVDTAQPAKHWYKGNLHTHSLWSDGNDFPDMIAAWYRDNDYQFLALTDHNILSEGDRWVAYQTVSQRGGSDAVDKYLDRFGEDWVEIRGDRETSSYSIRLKPLNEFRSLFEEPGEFLLMQGEEISDSAEGVPIHLNATNLRDLLPPVGGTTVVEAMENNVRAVREQAERTGRPILVHLNHPNFGYAITGEELARVVSEQFFEVYNGHPGVNHLGDASHASVERIWDVANTIRIAQLKAAPLLGMATDDSHNYHNASGATTGRGWVMVHASHLSPESIIEAMEVGDFYASSGVSLQHVVYDASSNQLTVAVSEEEGVRYAIEFIGTRTGYDAETQQQVDADGNPIRTTAIYSADVGEILDRVEGPTATYQLQGDELYVRALITSSKPHPNPSFADQVEQAWTQPVGWQKHIEVDSVDE